MHPSSAMLFFTSACLSLACLHTCSSVCLYPFHINHHCIPPSVCLSVFRSLSLQVATLTKAAPYSVDKCLRLTETMWITESKCKKSWLIKSVAHKFVSQLCQPISIHHEELWHSNAKRRRLLNAIMSLACEPGRGLVSVNVSDDLNIFELCRGHNWHNAFEISALACFSTMSQKQCKKNTLYKI